MAHQGLAALTSLAIALSAVACGEAPPPVETAHVAARPPVYAPSWPDAEAAWTPYHSVRFHLSVPLPDSSTWTLDDSSRPELIATQRSTGSTLVVLSEIEPALVNHDKCEERARQLGLVPDEKKVALRTVEDAVTVGPEAYDTHVRVAIEHREEDAGDGPIVGHVMAFGAYVRKCLFVHLATEVPSAGAEPILSDRLALARVRMLGGIRVDELGAVPREQPEAR